MPDFPQLSESARVRFHILIQICDLFEIRRLEARPTWILAQAAEIFHFRARDSLGATNRGPAAQRCHDDRNQKVATDVQARGVFCCLTGLIMVCLRHIHA